MMASNSTTTTTLSRNALYTPLVAYEQTELDPSAYMGNQKTIPSSLKESSLTLFLQSVGEDYHRNRATGPDPKNNGSRPLSVSDMDDRLRQRAVQLVGGGVNSAMSSSRRKLSDKLKKQKRPRREWNPVMKETLSMKSDASMDSLSFLREFNDRWNAYIFRLCGWDSQKASAQIEAPIFKSRFAAARKSMELAGAHIQIKECTQKRELVGKFGVIIGETSNTWSAVIRFGTRSSTTTGRKRRKSAKSRDNQAVHPIKDIKGSDDPNHHPPNSTVMEVVLVPKRGSTLEIIIPLRPQTKERQDGGEDESSNAEEPIITQATKSIFILLRPGALKA